MYYTGFADEAAVDIGGQIAATKALGWKFIESRNVNGKNLHDLPEDEFEQTAAILRASQVNVNCFGSAIANWQCDPIKEEDFQRSIEQLKRAIVRMQKLKSTMLRGMSFKAQWDRPAFDPEVEANVFRKVEFLVKMCEDAGILYLHENCNNYGGMSWKHTLKLLDKIKSPNFRLVFDTGNPVMAYDRAHGDKLDKRQSSWEFYANVREFIEYVHIKDAKYLGESEDGGFAKVEFTFPGEGDGDVEKIVTDLLHNNYDGGFSMEPHMKLVFHDNQSGEDKEREKRENYVEYGKRFMALVEKCKSKK